MSTTPAALPTERRQPYDVCTTPVFSPNRPCVFSVGDAPVHPSMLRRHRWDAHVENVVAVMYHLNGDNITKIGRCIDKWYDRFPAVAHICVMLSMAFMPSWVDSDDPSVDYWHGMMPEDAYQLGESGLYEPTPLFIETATEYLACNGASVYLNPIEKVCIMNQLVRAWNRKHKE